MGLQRSLNIAIATSWSTIATNYFMKNASLKQLSAWLRLRLHSVNPLSNYPTFHHTSSSCPMWKLCFTNMTISLAILAFFLSPSLSLSPSKLSRVKRLQNALLQKTIWWTNSRVKTRQRGFYRAILRALLHVNSSQIYVYCQHCSWCWCDFLNIIVQGSHLLCLHGKKTNIKRWLKKTL